MLEDHTGNPLANAEVSVARAGAANLAADLETDKSGLTRVEGLAAGDYDLEVSKPLYVTVKANVQVVDDTTALTVRLVRYAVVSGRVTGASGGPARNAVVRVLERSGADGPLKPLGGGQAVDENGEYRIFNLQPGQYAFAVSYGADRSSIAPKADGLGVQYYPGNANPQVFTVTGGEEFRGIDFYFGAGQVYRVTGLPEGYYVKSIQLGKGDVLEDGVEFTQEPEQPLLIVLSAKAATIRGSVTGAGAGVTIALVPQNNKLLERPEFYRTALTDQRGRFTLANLPPGEYKVFAWGDVENGAWMDPDFLKPVEEQGMPITMREGAAADLELKAIP